MIISLQIDHNQSTITKTKNKAPKNSHNYQQKNT